MQRRRSLILVWFLLLLAPSAWATGEKSKASPPEPTPLDYSVLISPYHLAYPMFLVHGEARLASQLGLGADLGVGSFRGGRVEQIGLRLPLYAGSFEQGFQLGPFVRATFHQLPNAHSAGPPKGVSAHSVGEVVYHDAEFARANAKNALFVGGILGLKYVIRNPRPFVDGFTAQGGLLLGYQVLFGDTGQEPSSEASRRGNGILPQLYVEVGYSF